MNPKPGAWLNVPEQRSQAIIVRILNRREFRAFAMAALEHSSDEARRKFTVEGIVKGLDGTGDAIVATDCFNQLIGGVALDMREPENPQIFLAWLERSIRRIGLATDMATLLATNYVLSVHHDVSFKALTFAQHQSAEASLKSLGFVAKELVGATCGDLEVGDRNPLSWTLPFDGLTSLLSSALRLKPEAVRPMHPSNIRAEIQFFHPVARDNQLRRELSTVIRDRRRPKR